MMLSKAPTRILFEPTQKITKSNGDNSSNRMLEYKQLKKIPAYNSN